MKNYKIIIQYDGTRYKGWQVQKSTDDTIQGKLQHVLETLVNHPVEVIGSGRTDAGVHAKYQVANFHIDGDFSEKKILEWLNDHLPQDIAVVDLVEVDDRFHSRYNAVLKSYSYRIWTSAVSNVFERKYLYEYKQKLDVKRMKEAADYLIGKHDFKSFCGNKKMKKSTVREIYSIDFYEIGDELKITYTGNGFLQNMIRIITGTLIEIGDGRREPSEILDILNALDREKAGYTAPACGLILEKVEYGTLDRNSQGR